MKKNKKIITTTNKDRYLNVTSLFVDTILVPA
jgi:hypothetical protein